MMRTTAHVLAFAIASVLAGCESIPQGARKPPQTWAALAPSRTCETLSGTYAATGTPAAENLRATLSSAASPARSLDALIERGITLRSGGAVAVVRIDVDYRGRASFSAWDDNGEAQPLEPRNWTCVGGRLQMRARLGTASTWLTVQSYRESHVRLWQNAEGALIAEETIESLERPLRRRSQWTRRPLARFYFRFAPASATDAAGPELGACSTPSRCG